MFKPVAVVEGEAFGAYLGARPASPSGVKTVTVKLAKGTQVLVPEGVCNGFQSLSPGVAQYLYCFDQEWRSGMAVLSVNPLDPAAAIAWQLPVDATDPAQISAKDASATGL
jgi:dTDP-4-dehydrorhamnose 3,5-epimerase